MLKKSKEISAHISDNEIVTRTIAYCETHKETYKDFVTDVLAKYFAEFDKELESKTKAQLIEMIKKGNYNICS